MSELLNSSKKYIIEHLEPEIYEWCFLEYTRISKIVGKENLLFTNVKGDKLSSLGEVREKSVLALNLKNACVLDPEAKETSTPEIAKKFGFFIFGGILGDNPPQTRTKDEITQKMNYPAFNIGKEQMSTDTAVIVVKKIVDGIPLEEMEFQQGVDIETSEGESCHLPYKYLVVDGKPLLPPGLVKMLKEQETF